VTNAAGRDESAALPLAISASSPLFFYTITPCRVVDTRPSAALLAGQARSFPVAGFCGIPSGARAVAANVTATGANSDGDVQMHPAGEPLPTASNVSFRAAQTRAAFAVLGLGAGGAVEAVGALSPGAGVHLVVDVTGYYAP
jgi:hypothetical protein